VSLPVDAPSETLLEQPTAVCATYTLTSHPLSSLEMGPFSLDLMGPPWSVRNNHSDL